MRLDEVVALKARQGCAHRVGYGKRYWLRAVCRSTPGRRAYRQAGKYPLTAVTHQSHRLSARRYLGPVRCTSTAVGGTSFSTIMFPCGGNRPCGLVRGAGAVVYDTSTPQVSSGTKPSAGFHDSGRARHEPTDRPGRRFRRPMCGLHRPMPL